MLASRGLSACCSKVMPMGSFSKSLRAFGPGHILKSSGTGRGVQITRKATGFHKISSFSGRLYPRKLNTARCSTAYCTYNMCSLKKTIPCAGDLGKNLFFCSRQQGVVNYHTDMGNAGGKEVVELMQKIKQEVYESLNINWLDKSDPAICYRELYLQNDINRCLSPHLKKVETELNMILDKADEEKDAMELKSLSTLVLNLMQLGVHFIHPVVTWDLLLTCVQRCGTADLPALVPLSAVCQQLFITEKAAWRGDVISEVVERFKDVLRENEKGFEHHDLVSVLQIAEKLSHFMSDNMFRDVASRINSEVEKHDLGFLNQNAAEIIKHVILFMSAPRKFGLYSPNRSINTDEYFPLQEIVFSTLQANKEDVVSVLGHHITRQGLMVIGNLNHRAVSLRRSVLNSCVQSISGFHGIEPLSNSKYKTDLIPQVDVDVNMEKGSSHLLGPDFGRLLCAVSTGLFKDTDWWILQEELFQSLRQGSVFSLIEVAEMLLSDHSILWSVKKASQKEFTMCFLHCWNDLNGHPRELRMILECIAVLAHPFYGIRDNELVSLLTRHLQSRCYMLPVRQLIHITSIIISYSSKASPPFLARPLLERLKSGDVHKMVSLLPRYVLKAFRDLEEFRVIGKLLDEMYYSLSLNDITKPDKDNLKWSRRKGIVTRWPKAVDRACLKQKYPTDAFYLITSLEFLEALEPRMLILEHHETPIILAGFNALLNINRAAVLECPELRIPWLLGSYKKSFQAHNYIWQGKNDMKNLLVSILGGEKYIAMDSTSPFLHHIDFEMQFDSQNRPIPVEEFNSSHTHRKVAINLPKKYHLMRVLSGTRTSQETRQLEILGYKVVMLFPKIWESYHLWRQQEFLRQAISDMGHNIEGEGHLKDLNEENYLQD